MKLLLLLYFIGTVFWGLYFMFDTKLLKKKVLSKLQRHYIAVIKQLKDTYSIDNVKDMIETLSFTQKQIIKSLFYNCPSPLTLHNHIQFYNDIPTAYHDMFKELEHAVHHIHLEFYILRDDELGQKLQQILLRKASQNIRIRVLYDGVGSFSLKKKYINKLVQAGIEVRCFFPIFRALFERTINYRDHRKIVIIDGKIGYTGGANIGKEYLGLDSKVGFWRDTFIRIEGESVRVLQNLFLLNWTLAKGQEFQGTAYFPDNEVLDQKIVQVISSAPGDAHQAILGIQNKMLFLAQKSIRLTTPYFIPDEGLLRALKMAAQEGIDVQIIVPCKEHTDSIFAWYASMSFMEELLQTGVRVFVYQKGFIHSKLCIVDRDMATLGTANFDIRSFILDFEVNLMLYDVESIQILTQYFNEDLRNSMEVKYEDFVKRSTADKIKEKCIRCFSKQL